MNNRIIYLTGVPWGWIKQRPQFLAEALSTDYKVDVYCKKPNSVKSSDLLNKVNTDNVNLKVKSFRQLPFHAIPVLRKLPLTWVNRLFLKCQLPNLDEYDIVWVTSAPMYNLIKSWIKPHQILVYDCMDDILEFPITKNNPQRRQTILQQEIRLLKAAQIVFCSAEYLKGKIVNRSGINGDKVTVVNNAVEIPKIEQNHLTDSKTRNIIDFLRTNKSLVYIGTIDNWFDYDSVTCALESDPNLNLVLIGPMKGYLPDHNRIHYMGTVPHDVIFDIMPHAHALIMPFKLNELIKSVNPVKLYEYIYAGVPVIANKYGETLKFNEFVHLYGDSKELCDILSIISSDTVPVDIMKNHEFVASNTWTQRYQVIKSKLFDLCDR